MLMFSLTISCLTISNVRWFTDLTFQVPMQYCSLQKHQTLLPSPVTSTTGRCFCFSSVSSVFLELLLYSSPIVYWAPTNLGNSFFSVIIFLPFHTVYGLLKTRILKWFAIPFSSGPHFVRTYLWLWWNRRSTDQRFDGDCVCLGCAYPWRHIWSWGWCVRR